MDGYKILSLNKESIDTISEKYGENYLKNILSDFSCPLNKDVEKFLRTSAIIFAQQGIAQTHLVFASYKSKPVLCGYFTLTNKNFTIKKNFNISNSLKKRLMKFATYNNEFKNYAISAPLIAQLGKNFSNGYNELITGDELLKIACDMVKSIQGIIGGKFVYLECEDKPKLTEFYEKNGFINFGQRHLDKDEKDDLSGEYLIQLLKYLK